MSKIVSGVTMKIARVPPILFALAGWGVTLAFSAIVTTDWVMNNDAIAVPMFFATALLVTLLPMASLIQAIRRYTLNKWYLVRIIELYIILALVFANLVYVLIAVADPVTLYEGIQNPWEWLPGTQGRRMHLDSVLRSAIDCVNFSLATMTTSSYGDMKPVTWYTSLLSNIEVLAGLALVSIGLGRYFTDQPGTSH